LIHLAFKWIGITIAALLALLFLVGLLDAKFHFIPTEHPSTGRLAVTSGRDIYVERAESSEAIRLTRDSSTNAQPAWSAGGQRIAFVSDRDAGRNESGTSSPSFQIYVMNADGTSQVRLTDIPGGCELPTWSPDGKLIACISARLVFIVDVQTGRVVELTGGEQPSENQVHLGASEKAAPSWAPDGRHLVFASAGAIRIADVESSRSVVVAYASPARYDWFRNEHVDLPAAPVWSPDGSLLAFATGKEIHVIDVDGANERSVAVGYWPAWSPDSTRLAFSRMDDPALVRHYYIVNSDGTHLVNVSDRIKVGYEGQGASFYVRPVWSPDGREIAFEFDLGGEGPTHRVGLYAGKADGSGVYRLTELGSSIYGLWWASWTN
jgi:Tol biopolymer transport system component